MLAKQRKASASADKLDILMDIMFGYLDECCEEGGRAEEEAVFAILLELFHRSVLDTHRCKFTQFLLFYHCRRGDAYSTRFIESLLAKAFDSGVPPVTRCAAAAYLSGFVARAGYLKEERVLPVKVSRNA